MSGEGKNNKVYDYLCVDKFLNGFLDVQSLNTALQSGLIDLLLNKGNTSEDDLAEELRMDANGLNILVGLLKLNNIIRLDDALLALTEEFRKALTFRDLLEAKIDFANYIAPDVLEYFSDYVTNLDSFMEHSRIFDLFSYHRCYELTDENLSMTGKWMAYTSAYTRYEAPVCFDNHDFSNYQSMLDIGGNSGEFAYQACRANPGMTATVLDLPVVCELGCQYISNKADADRLNFYAADMLTDGLPSGNDLVTFKSVLHDWPEEAVDMILSRALNCLTETGHIMIFERMKPASIEEIPGYGNLPVFLFIRYYRNPEYYKKALEKMGFRNIEVKKIQLEMPFMLISGSKN